MRLRLLGVLAVVALVGVFTARSPDSLGHADEGSPHLVLDGRDVEVSFHDGDTFRVKRGLGYRVVSFNTLETHGPVHRWGRATARLLYDVAVEAAANARRGGWNCTSLGQQDAYRRGLADCPDLALDQIERGLGHAYSIDERPAPPELVAAQERAIRAHRGMWVRGAPDFIVTSTHSVGERGREHASNRLISTRDGHTESMQHDERYADCTWVCVSGGACMLHVDFAHRHGGQRPSCLRTR